MNDVPHGFLNGDRRYSGSAVDSSDLLERALATRSSACRRFYVTVLAESNLGRSMSDFMAASPALGSSARWLL